MRFLPPSTFLLAAGLMVATAQPPVPLPMRFTLRPEGLVLSNCLAQPGAVPLSLPATNANLEIVDWAAAPVATPEPGEFTLHFAAPLPVGGVIAYGAEAVHFQSAGRWETLEPGPEAGRKLQFLALPPGATAEAIRFTVGATPLPRTAREPERFQATLRFATLLPLRLENVARDATVAASLLAAGRQPVELVDGLVGRDSALAGPGGTNDWVMLSWPLPRTFRGLAMFREEGQARQTVVVEAFTGAGDPRASGPTNEWRRLVGRATAPGLFQGNEFFVTREAQQTRALRLTGTNRAGLGLSEIVVLRDLGMERIAAAKAAVTKSLTVPRAAGRLGVDGRAHPWPTARTNGFALAWDEERIHILYQATGEAARFENPGTNIHELFHGGDAVELMLQTRDGLDAQRARAGRGDLRVVFSLFQGRAVAVLYEFHADDLLVLPVTFRSGARVVECDKVTELKEARVEFRRQPDALTIEASVPWKALGMTPAALKETRGDFGRIFATPPRRERWAETAQIVPGDLAAGAELHPARWGVLKFGGN